MFTEETKQAIIQVAEYCAQDMEYEFASDPMVVAETALDAGRLGMQGYDEAQQEVRDLVEKHDWDTVVTAASKFVPTA